MIRDIVSKVLADTPGAHALFRFSLQADCGYCAAGCRNRLGLATGRVYRSSRRSLTMQWKHYRCLSVPELCAFQLPTLADDATLFLWRVASMQREALDVMAAWGFTLKTEIIWVKRTTTGKRWFGMGRTVRAEHETCLVGTRGRPITRRKNIRSTFEAPVGQHSEKPASFYDLIEALRDGPYVELFARGGRAGWTSLGDQVP